MKKLKVYRLSLGWQIMLGLVIGIILGVVFTNDKKFIAFANGLGSTFINMISMIVLPIVFSSLVVGIANMGDIKKLGRVGLKTLIYFEVLSTIAFIIGMVVSNFAKLGYMLDLNKLSQVDISSYVKTAKQASHSGLGSILMSIVPSNFF